MGNTYYYHICGLNVESEIELPEAREVQCFDNTDVKIQYGKMPDRVKEQKELGSKACYWRPNSTWFHTDAVGDFYVSEGREILIELEEEIDVRLLRAMILGPGIGNVLVHKNILSLHGGGVVAKNQTIIICGDSGSGKSTIVNELIRNQYSLLGDDTVVIKQEEEIAMAIPAYPQQKLCKDAAISSGYDISTLLRLDEEREKYAIPRKDKFANQSTPIQALFYIVKSKQDELKIQEMRGSEKLSILVKNLYMSQLYQVIGVPPELMLQCITLAKQIPIYKIERPIGRMTVQEIVHKIQSITEQQCIVLK